MIRNKVILSEEAKNALKLTKEDLSWWEKRTKEIEEEWRNNKSLQIEKWKKCDPGISEERIQKINEQTIRVNKEIIKFLKEWRTKNGELSYEMVYHPSIEKEIGSEYGKQNLNFEIIMVVLGLVFFLILTRKR